MNEEFIVAIPFYARFCMALPSGPGEYQLIMIGFK
jgi:hypothetical protein